MVLTPGGKLSRYFYDVKFPPRDLRLGLVEASEEKIGSPVDVVLLYCSHYDPQTGKYTASILNFVRAGGVFTIMVVVGMMWILFRRGKKKRAAAAKQATPAGLETAGNSRGEGP
jgi:protein SCO1/2